MGEKDVDPEFFADDPPPRRRSPLFRLIAILVLISFVLVWAPGVASGIQTVFASR